MNEIERKLKDFDYRIYRSDTGEEVLVASGKGSFERIEEATAAYLHQCDAIVVEIWR